MKSTLTQLFWPKNSLDKQGYIIGWSIRGFTCCIITVVSQDFHILTEALLMLGEKAEILGTVGKEHENIEAKTKSDIWITAESDSKKIIITELHCCGYKYKANAHVIYFDHYYFQKSQCNLLCPTVFFRQSYNYKNKLKKPELSTLQIVSEKINRCQFVEERLRDLLTGNSIFRCAKAEQVSYGNILVLIIKELAEICYMLYCFNVPVINLSLKDLPFRSKFVQQLTSRLNLLREWEYNKNHLEPMYSCPYIGKSYINSYIRSQSAIFTIIADFMLGLSILFILHYFSTDTLVVVHTLGSTIHIEVLRSEVDWLMGLPAGFKPNEALDNALGTNILLLINFWNYVTTYLTEFETEIIQFFAVFGLFGMSFQLALLSDLIDFCTLHM
jgi:N-acetylglucosaminyl transferase component (Gpi1)